LRQGHHLCPFRIASASRKPQLPGTAARVVRLFHDVETPKQTCGTFDRAAGSVLAPLNQKACDPMENPLALWLGMALYAAIGLFGIFVFHDSASIQDLTAGYGVAYRTIASSETAK
jgi:hypothetical protein